MAWSSVTTSSESRLDRTWHDLRLAGRRALVPYLTAGFPDFATSLEALRLAAGHADILEVGVPFSDPLADGPTIQASTFRALAQGMTLARTLELIDTLASPVPVVLFSYLNPVMQYGVERLAADAAAIGVSGILLTDLPAGADAGVEGSLLDSPLDLIRLVAPTTRGERLRETVRDAQGFVYLVARLGVTGASQRLDTGLADSIATVRGATPLPIAAGFGIGTPEQAREVARLADGVVVGSALVAALDHGGPEAMATLLRSLRDAVDTT